MPMTYINDVLRKGKYFNGHDFGKMIGKAKIYSFDKYLLIIK